MGTIREVVGHMGHSENLTQLFECTRCGKHDWRRTYRGKRFDVIRCRRCGLLATEKEDGTRA